MSHWAKLFKPYLLRLLGWIKLHNFSLNCDTLTKNVTSVVIYVELFEYLFYMSQFAGHSSRWV
jgi:uncharacterized membrane protein (DUF373 family)